MRLKAMGLKRRGVENSIDVQAAIDVSVMPYSDSLTIYFSGSLAKNESEYGITLTSIAA